METPPPLRSFGRIRSRTLKPRQASLIETLLPSLRPPSEGPVDPARLWPSATETWMEVGFGGGEHMAAQAAGRPDVVILGAEPFVNGVASALRHLDDQGLSNVRIHDGDVRDLMSRLPDACLQRLFVLFPDPWPLRPGGRLRLATDWAAYADVMLAAVLADGHFDWSAQTAADWREAPADHVPTRYEAKRLGDCAPVWLDFVRRPA